MIEVIPYSKEYKFQWDTFVSASKNGTFLFKRDYMDYHSNRFDDSSLMIFYNHKLLALLPANKNGNELHSHQGLTYGGFITSSLMTVSIMLEVFSFISQYLLENGFSKVIYKPVPHIYHSIPAEEDLYCLFLHNATVVSSNISSAIFLNNKLPFIESRKSGIRKALRNGVVCEESNDFGAFWAILNDNLTAKYNKQPVHSLKEMLLLKSRFPINIKLYTALIDCRVLGGTVIYETGKVIHTQYISASPEGKSVGALDLLFNYLINDRYKDSCVFDFGQSTEQSGHYLNESLIFQKEGFGGRGIMYNTYEWDLV